LTFHSKSWYIVKFLNWEWPWESTEYKLSIREKICYVILRNFAKIRNRRSKVTLSTGQQNLHNFSLKLQCYVKYLTQTGLETPRAQIVLVPSLIYYVESQFRRERSKTWSKMSHIFGMDPNLQCPLHRAFMQPSLLLFTRTR